MKLIVQIPCYNEEKTLLSVLEEIPKKIPWITLIETMVIDDGSSDNTLTIASEFWVHHIIQLKKNSGLGNAFRIWVEKALLAWADILVNTDGDNQYPGKYIEKLVLPLLEWKADIVMWDRQTKTIEHFSLLKKFFQYFGSALVRYFSGTKVPDSVSGFRAYSRESLLKLNITSSFSYAVDTLVQAGNKSLKIDSVKITTNKPTRPSRLFSNMWQHMAKTFSILFRVYAMYHPMKLFFTFAFPFFLVGLFGVTRFLYYYYLFPQNTGKIQSLLLSGVCLIIAIQLFALGIVGDLIAKNRKLTEDQLYISKKLYFDRK